MSYAKGTDTSPLKDLASNEVADFSSQQVTNVTGDTTAPTVQSASVDHTYILTLTFSEALTATNTPDASRFTVAGTEAALSVTVVAFKSGDPASVVLTLSVPGVVKGNAGITVSYAKGTDASPLKDLASNEVADFSSQQVTNLSGVPEVESATVDGSTLTLTFDKVMKTTSVPGTSRFTVAGTDSTTSVTAVAFKTGDAKSVELTLSPAVTGGDTGITVSYTRGDETNELQDTGGTEVVDFSGQKVTNETDDTTAPTVQSATVDGSTLTLIFNEALKTTNAPGTSRFTVAGTDSTTTVTAVGFKTGDAKSVELTLSPAVADTDTGITVSYAKGSDANPLQDRSGNEVANFSGQQVENTPPEVTDVAVVSTPSLDVDDSGTAETYGLGEEIRVRVTFSGAVDVDTTGGTPRLKIKMHADFGEKWADYAGGTGTAALTFAYTVVSPNSSRGGTPVTDDGIAVLANTLELNGGTIKSAGAARDAGLAHAGLAHDANHKVDHSKAPGPVFQSAAVDGTALAVTFSKSLDTASAPAGSAFSVEATPSGGAARTIAGTGTAAISGAVASVTLASAVAVGEMVTVGYTKPSASPLQDGTGTDVVNFSGQAVANHTLVGVTAVAVVSTPSIDADNSGTAETYGLGETIRVRLTFGETVNVDTTHGTPRLKIRLQAAAGERWADYAGGSGTAALVFAYTVASADTSADGIAVVEDTLEMNGGTIKVAETQADVALGHAGLANDANHKVDGSKAPAPVFQSASVTGATLAVTFSGNLDTGSAPAGRAFDVEATPSGGAARRIAGTGTVSIAGAVATVALASAVAHGETVTVEYTRPATNPLQDSAGTDVLSFTGQPVTNATRRPQLTPAAPGHAAAAPAGWDAGCRRRGRSGGRPWGFSDTGRLGKFGPGRRHADLRLEPDVRRVGGALGRGHGRAVLRCAGASGCAGVPADGLGSRWAHRQRRGDGDGARCGAELRRGGGVVADAGAGRGDGTGGAAGGDGRQRRAELCPDVGALGAGGSFLRPGVAPALGHAVSRGQLCLQLHGA